MSLILGNGGQGKQLARTTPIQVTGLKAVGQDGGVLLTCDPATEASAPYLKDLWVVWKKKADGPIQNPYDGQHMTFAAQTGPVGQDLAKLAPGSTLKIMENNVAVQFLVLQQGYPETGNGNTLLLRKDIYNTSAWNGTTANAYAGSAVDVFLTNQYLLLLEEKIRDAVVQAAIAYTPGNGDYTVTTIQRKVFLLSGTEVGFTAATLNTEGSTIPYFNTNERRIRTLQGEASSWWLRSPRNNFNRYAYCVAVSGAIGDSETTTPRGVCPAFCLPSTMQVSLEPDSQGDYTLV